MAAEHWGSGNVADYHEDVKSVGADVQRKLVAALEAWEKADCDCCSPTPLDWALEGLDAPEFGDRLRRFGISLAQAGQWIVEPD